MIKFFTCFLAFLSINFFAQNKLNSPDFWKSTPTIAQIKNEISLGNSATALDASAFDATTRAILSNASLEVITFLLSFEENSVHKITHDSRSYLHWAAMRGNFDLAKLLIQKGADVHLLDSKEASPLEYYANSGGNNLDFYDLFFKNGVSPQKKYKQGTSLIHYAIANDTDDFKVTNFLLTKGLSLQDKDDHGATTLDYAAKSGKVSRLEFLKSKGILATPYALIFAAQNFNKNADTSVFAFLLEKMGRSVDDAVKGNTILHILANKDNSSELLHFFIQRNANANAVNSDGEIPLMMAAKNSNSENLAILLQETKNPSHINKNGQNALAYALQYGSVENLKLLIDAKLNPLVIDNKKNTLPYFLVTSYNGRDKNRDVNFLAKADFLKTIGIDFSTPQEEGNTILHLAAAKNNLKLVQLILNLGVPINSRNANKDTPLHTAALVAKDIEIFTYLVENGADKSIKNDLDETPYDIASNNEILVKNKVNLSFLK